MKNTWMGKSVRRKEDPRFLTGSGTFVDDLSLPGMLHGSIYRSPHSHARIAGIHLEKTAQEHAACILTPEVVKAISSPMIEISENFSGTCSFKYYCLAGGVTRYVGEPILALASQDKYVAEDLLEKVQVDFKPLPAITNIEQALSQESPVLYDGWKSNTLYRQEYTSGDIEGAFTGAAFVLSERFYIGRNAGTPIENRGCVAWYRPAEGQLTLWTSTQRPHNIRTLLSDVVRIPENRIRVIAPDVGGAFGVKGGFYPEEAITSLLSIRTGRPVKWIESRRENLLACAQGGDQSYEIQMAVDKEGTILGVKNRIIADVGCGFYSRHGSLGITPVVVGAVMTPGPYKIRNWHFELLCAVTNKTPYGAIRGFGQQAGRFAIERMMDLVAKHLNLDPVQVRLKNMVKKNDFPFMTAMNFSYDSGSYTESLEEVARLVSVSEFKAQQDRFRKDGRYIGFGIACQVGGSTPSSSYTGESGRWRIGYDSATTRIEPSGTISLFTGSCPGGQGHETTMAQVMADEFGVHMDDVTVLHGDTETCPYSAGTFGNRAAVATVASAVTSARQLKDKMLRIAAHILKVDVSSLEMDSGKVYSKLDGRQALTIKEIASIAYLHPSLLPPDIEPGLTATSFFEPPSIKTQFLTYHNSCHAAIVEVFPDTGKITILRYVIVHDTGRVINPMIVDGQVHGSFGLGVGHTLYEEITYDKEGQPAATTLMDYLVPTAADVCALETIHLETPSPLTFFGAKGMGDSDAIPVTAAVANALENALESFSVKIREAPFTPERIWRLIRNSNKL